MQIGTSYKMITKYIGSIYFRVWEDSTSNNKWRSKLV